MVAEYITQHDVIIQPHQYHAEQACIKKACEPAFIQAGERYAQRNEPKQARKMGYYIMQGCK